MTSRELRHKRKALVDEQRRVMQPALEAARGFNADEQVALDKMDADLAGLDALIARVERVETEERAFVPESQRETAIAQTAQASDTNAAYRDAFWSYVRHGAVNGEFRAMSVGTDTSGGFTVPDEFRRQLIVGLDELNVMRGISSVFTSTSGTLTIPSNTTRVSAAWNTEAGAYTESTPVFAEVTWSAHKASSLVKVSEELLNDSAFPLEQWLANEFARALAEIEETAFVAGTGSGQPKGVVGGSELGKTATATNAITANELMDTYHALGRGYRARASWLMNDSTKAAIRKLVTGVSGDLTYIWQPGLSAGEPDKLLGQPVLTSPDVDAIAATKKVVVFGDFSYYYIVDRQQIGMQRLNELYAANGQVGFRIFKRTDGKVALASAFKHLLTAT